MTGDGSDLATTTGREPHASNAVASKTRKISLRIIGQPNTTNAAARSRSQVALELRLRLRAADATDLHGQRGRRSCRIGAQLPQRRAVGVLLEQREAELLVVIGDELVLLGRQVTAQQALDA